MSEQKKILVVDDEQDLVETIRSKLSSEGYKVFAAHTGVEALEKAKDTKPDLILLDIMMPELNGYQVCKKIKEDDSLKNIPDVILTAKAQESDKFWGLETGADDYITKPFEFKSLLKTITKHLKHE